MSVSITLPNIAEILGSVLQRVDREVQPLLIAIAERLAADRYRSWAASAGDEKHAADLLVCAEREVEIASRVEALYPDASSAQAQIRADNPDLEEINRSIFAGRSIEDQYAIQAQGEHAGASVWRALAEGAPPATRETFLACAELEEKNAAVLEAILRTLHPS